MLSNVTHSNSYFECNKKRGCIDQLYIELGLKQNIPGVSYDMSSVRNHVKLRGFSKDTLLFGGFWLWAWRISWGLQTCIAERSKVPNG